LNPLVCRHAAPMQAAVLAACAFVAIVASAPAQAQRIEAARYVNEQGVEFLVNRGAARPSDAVSASTADTTTPLRAKAVPANSGPDQGPLTAPPPGERRVDVVQQTARDSERARILTQELLTEGQALEVKRKALNSPRAQTDLNTEERQKLADDVQRHEANVKALDRELSVISGTGAVRKGVQASSVRWAP
jgi:hypothetical protein